jgi:hypothetical protein
MLLRTAAMLLIVITTIIAGLPLPAAAQPAGLESPGFRSRTAASVGVKGGLLLSSLRQDKDVFTTRNGWIGGVFLGSSRSGRLDYGMNVLYARKRVNDPGGSRSQLNMNSVNVPLYVRFNDWSSGFGRDTHGFVVVGLDSSFLVTSRLGSSGKDVTGQFRRVGYGVAIGFGFEVSRALVEARYTREFGSVLTDANRPRLTAESFSVTYGFRLN